MPIFTGTPGNDTIVGGPGPDTLIGLTGDDSYFVNDPGDQIVEAPGEGYDIVYSAVDYVLSAGAEVELLGTVDNFATTPLKLTGNERSNYVVGNAGANTLDGGGGADTLWGREGADTYFVDSDDVVIEFAGHGSDTVYARSDFTLGAGMAIELLATADNFATTPIALRGNELNQTIIGNAGDNLLVGGGGTDILQGRIGNDTYYVTTNFSASEAAGQGFDVVYTTVSYRLGANNEIELLGTADRTGTAPLLLYGNGYSQRLIGNAGNNVLDGNFEALAQPSNGNVDTLEGGAGNDIYYLSTSADIIVETVGGGNDEAYARTSYSLNAGAEVELLALLSDAQSFNLAGNEFGQTVRGNNGSNTIDGRGGADSLLGGTGVDVFAFTTAPGGGNVDAILDFLAGTDKIGLDDAIFAGVGTPGSFNANAFFAGTAAHDLDDRIIYDQATGQLFYDADGNGAGAQILFATLSGSPAIGAGDFTVI